MAEKARCREKLMLETGKKISELKNTEPAVLAENILSLVVWLLMEKKKRSNWKESMKHGAVDYTGFDCTDEIIWTLSTSVAFAWGLIEKVESHHNILCFQWFQI